MVLLTLVFGMLLISQNIQLTQYSEEAYNTIHDCEAHLSHDQHCEYRITAEVVKNNKEDTM